MSQRVYTVGTDPVVLARDHADRASIVVSMPPTSAVAANTGIIYINKGAPSAAVVGSPIAGDPITQGSQFTELPSYDGDPTVFKGQVWAVSDTAGQQVVVDETYKSGEGK